MDNEVDNIKDVIEYQIFSLGTNSVLPFQEMYNIGYLGYLKAQKNYDARHGKMTLKYASMYIRAEILGAIKKEQRYRRDHINDELLVDLEPGNLKEEPVDMEKIALIKKALTVLNYTERYVLENKYFILKGDGLEYTTEGLSYKVLAEKTNLTESQLHAINYRALEKLRRVLN
jgi:RNA polymerase sigma factor (sigma-70 family)